MMRLTIRQPLPTALAPILLALLLGHCGAPDGLSQARRHFSVAPAQVDFGAVVVGVTHRQWITLENTGEGVLGVRVRGLDGALGFAGDPGGISIKSGERVAWEISFAPAAVEDYAAQLEFDSGIDGATPRTVSLSGTGLPRPDCNDGNDCTNEYFNVTLEQCVRENRDGGCDDGDDCTADDACQEGVCTGTLLNCADSVDCTLDRCEAGVCKHYPADSACPDTDENPCEVPVCDVHDGCGMQDASEGTACGDVNCLEANVCIWGGCRVVGESWLNGKPCDDGDACTTTDQCQDGTCRGAGQTRLPHPVAEPGTVLWASLVAAPEELSNYSVAGKGTLPAPAVGCDGAITYATAQYYDSPEVVDEERVVADVRGVSAAGQPLRKADNYWVCQGECGGGNAPGLERYNQNLQVVLQDPGTGAEDAYVFTAGGWRAPLAGNSIGAHALSLLAGLGAPLTESMCDGDCVPHGVAYAPPVWGVDQGWTGPFYTQSLQRFSCGAGCDGLRPVRSAQLFYSKWNAVFGDWGAHWVLSGADGLWPLESYYQNEFVPSTRSPAMDLHGNLWVSGATFAGNRSAVGNPDWSALEPALYWQPAYNGASGLDSKALKLALEPAENHCPYESLYDSSLGVRRGEQPPPCTAFDLFPPQLSAPALDDQGNAYVLLTRVILQSIAEDPTLQGCDSGNCRYAAQLVLTRHLLKVQPGDYMDPVVWSRPVSRFPFATWRYAGVADEAVCNGWGSDPCLCVVQPDPSIGQPPEVDYNCLAQRLSDGADLDFIARGNPVIGADGAIFAPTVDGKVLGFSPDGIAEREFFTPDGDEVPFLRFNELALGDNNRLFATNAAGLFAFNLDSRAETNEQLRGMPVWSRYTESLTSWTLGRSYGCPYLSAPTIGRDGSILVDVCGNLVAVANDGYLDNGPWPKVRGDLGNRGRVNDSR